MLTRKAKLLNPAYPTGRMSLAALHRDRSDAMRLSRIPAVTYLLPIFAVLTLCGAARAGADGLDKAAVLKTARTFCDAAAIKIDGAISAARIEGHSAEARHYYGALWSVKAGAKATIEVADSNGEVVGFYRSPGSAADPATAKQVTPPDAISIASAFVTAAGQKAEIADFPVVTPKDAGVLAAHFPACLIVSWRRLKNGVPYYYDNVNVLIEAATGQVLRFAVNFHAPAPGDVTESITAQDASSTAQKLVADLANTTDLTMVPPRKVIVQVDGKATRRFEGRSESGRERLVWACGFETPGKKLFEAWVDIASGDVVGGVIRDGS